jgi:MFS family permease
VSIANGGGTISDMYEPSERAGIFGWYLLGPLLGPTLGPLLGGIIIQHLEWPWLFWMLAISCVLINITSFLFLKETYVPVLLAKRKKELEKTEGGNYYYEGEDGRPLSTKMIEAWKRPLKILFTQPIVITMASYQALIFATTYSLYTQFQSIYGDGYGFNSLQVGFVYLGPGLGFLAAVWFIVPKIDTVYKYLTEKHGGEAQPEYRLPIANIGSVLIPTTMFAFAWLIEYHVHWFASVVATFFYGIGQVCVFNAVQNYYIDSFEKYAASAIAAGALFRSIIGGVVPLLTPTIIDNVGVGWGISIFAFIGVTLAPSPYLFSQYGALLREKYKIVL